MNKISFCITCKERLYHLEQTLMENLKILDNYPNTEIVLLDYNSSDGLEEWVSNNMMVYIIAKKLIYFKTYEPESFKMSHAKNLCHNIADGDILCNLDADNFLSISYVDKLITVFKNNENPILKCITRKGVGGRIAVRKEVFHEVRGYDELVDIWGNDDKDFFIKCLCHGCTLSIYKSYVHTIKHTDNVRFKNMEAEKHIYMQIKNIKQKLKNNFLNGKIKSNYGMSYGEGIVYKNFSDVAYKIINVPEFIKYPCIKGKISSDIDTELNIVLYEHNNLVLRQRKNPKLFNISAFWYKHGTWDMVDDNIHITWFDNSLEIFEKTLDVYISNNRQRITLDESIYNIRRG